MAFPVPGHIAERLRRSTAHIRSGSRVRQGSGSGVVISSERVLTNGHVVQGDETVVETWEGKSHSAHLLKMNYRRDLALLHVPGLAAPAVTLGDSATLKTGQPIFAVGNPFGFTGALSTGVVHSIGPLRGLGRYPWVQASIRLAPGNSGGPLADLNGNVIGINTMLIARLALAIPANAVQEFIEHGAIPPRIGIVVRPVPFIRENIPTLGLLVLEIAQGSPAEQASLLPGDILVSSNGLHFTHPDDLQEAIASHGKDLFLVEFLRGDHKTIRRVNVVLPVSGRVRAA